MYNKLVEDNNKFCAVILMSYLLSCREMTKPSVKHVIMRQALAFSGRLNLKRSQLALAPVNRPKAS